MPEEYIPLTCQCEHTAHLDPPDITGSGGCKAETAYKVKTIYGTYYICESCLQVSHMSPYAELEEL